MARDLYIFKLNDSTFHRELASKLHDVEAAATAEAQAVAAWRAAIAEGLPTGRLCAAEEAAAEQGGAF